MWERKPWRVGKGGFRDADFLGGASYCFRGFEGVYMGGVTESKNYYSISL